MRRKDATLIFLGAVLASIAWGIGLFIKDAGMAIVS